MTLDRPFGTVLLPVGLGLLGFVDPCPLGSRLMFVKSLEGRGAIRSSQSHAGSPTH